MERKLKKKCIEYKSQLSNQSLFKLSFSNHCFIILSLISLLIRDRYTAFHSYNVAYYASEIGKAMGLSKKECFSLYLGGLLHDVGKMNIPKSILNKPSRLTEQEFELIKQHPYIGYSVLKHIPYLKEKGILDMVLYHHEKLDGTGYPFHLKENEIPLYAKIMSVADSFDAMTSKRVYRDRLSIEYAIRELERGKGKQFDGKIVDVLLELLKNDKVDVKGILKLKINTEKVKLKSIR